MVSLISEIKGKVKESSDKSDPGPSSSGPSATTGTSTSTNTLVSQSTAPERIPQAKPSVPTPSTYSTHPPDGRSGNASNQLSTTPPPAKVPTSNTATTEENARAESLVATSDDSRNKRALQIDTNPAPLKQTKVSQTLNDLQTTTNSSSSTVSKPNQTVHTVVPNIKKTIIDPPNTSAQSKVSSVSTSVSSRIPQASNAKTNTIQNIPEKNQVQTISNRSTAKKNLHPLVNSKLPSTSSRVDPPSNLTVKNSSTTTKKPFLVSSNTNTSETINTKAKISKKENQGVKSGVKDVDAQPTSNGVNTPSTLGTMLNHGNTGGGGVPGNIADPKVVKAVHDIIAMLQTYGPLTHDQLEYNLPPLDPPEKLQQILDILNVIGILNIVDENATDATQHNENDSSDPKVKSDPKLQKEIAVGKSLSSENIKVDDSDKSKSSTASFTETKASDLTNKDTKVKEEATTNVQQKSTSVGEVVKADSTSSPQKENSKKPYRYVFLDGVTRTQGDTIFLPQLLPALESARLEIMESQARINILREELKVEPCHFDDFKKSYPHPVQILRDEKSTDDKDDKTNRNQVTKKKKRTGREILLSMVHQFPSILEDQVYATALKNFNC